MDGRYARLRRVVARLTPDQLRTFAQSLDDPADVGLLEEVVGDLAAEAERSAESVVHWRADPARMALHFEPKRFQPHPYFLYLGQKFRDLVTGADPFQVWEVPAQHGKSSLASQYGPAWALDRDPAGKWLCTTYGDDLADRNGLAVRDILVEHGDQLRAPLRRDQTRRDRFLTPDGGGVLSAGVYAIGSGWSATAGIVVDDPYKGWEQAHSSAQRDRLWNTFRSVIWMRRAGDETPVLICTTRWHEDDIAAKLAALEADLGVSFTISRLAQYAEAPDLDSADPTLRLPDPLGRRVGESLGRFSDDALRVKRAVLGEYLHAGMEQQRPAPAAGTEILREWLQVVEELPRTPSEAVASWDLKGKDKESGDYAVGQCWWRVGGSYWLMDQLRGPWGNDTVKCGMALMKVRHPEIGRQWFENAGNAPELTAELRRGDGNYTVSDRAANLLGMTEDEREQVQALIRHGLSDLVPVTPKGEKSIRMRAVVPLLEGMNVFLPAGKPWVAGYLEELAAFPNGSYDDQVDATSQALSKLSRPPGKTETAGESAPRVPTRPSAVPGGRSGPRVAVMVPGVSRR